MSFCFLCFFPTGNETVSKMNFSCDVIICFLSFCAFYEPGWALGEHGEWAKYSNFDITTRVPLMFYVPGRTAPLPEAGKKLFPYIDPFDPSESLEPGIPNADLLYSNSSFSLYKSLYQIMAWGLTLSTFQPNVGIHCTYFLGTSHTLSHRGVEGPKWTSMASFHREPWKAGFGAKTKEQKASPGWGRLS